MIHRLFALISMVALAGCVSGPVKLPVTNLADSANTQVEDLRPASEKTQAVFSYMITNERFGYRRLAQDATDPTGPRLFSHLLHEKYGAMAAPQTKLHHFVVYLDERAAIKRSALTAAVGEVIASAASDKALKRDGELIHSLVDAAKFDAESEDNEYKRAIYNDPNRSAGEPMYVIYIETESQQKKRFTRTVWPLKPLQVNNQPSLYQAMDAAIRFNLSQ